MSRILIIDDDPNFQAALKGLLESYNFSVTVASDGEEGVAAARGNVPDIVLCDINMPEMTGFEVFQQLNEVTSTQTIPFIFLSARSDLDSFRKGMGLGANDYLTKPFSAEDLLNAINIRLKQQQMVERKYESTLSLLRKNIIYALPHEFRTPLMGVLGYGTLLQSDHETMTLDDIGMFAGEIVKAGIRLQQVIENYLVHAQLELISTNAEEIKAMRRHFVLADKVIKKYAELAVEPHKRASDLVLELEPNLGLRISDENLGKIITELVDNSCKFSTTGSPIKIKALRDGENVLIEVRDYGRGMSKESIDAIGAFMQFERGIYEQQGVGLGLSIVKKLSELHNGTLTIQSPDDKGLKIYLKFAR